MNKEIKIATELDKVLDKMQLAKELEDWRIAEKALSQLNGLPDVIFDGAKTNDSNIIIIALDLMGAANKLSLAIPLKNWRIFKTAYLELNMIQKSIIESIKSNPNLSYNFVY